MSRQIASYTFNYTMTSKEDYWNATRDLRSVIEKAVQDAIKNYQNTHEEVETIKGGLVDFVSENVSSFSGEAFDDPWYMPLFTTTRMSFAEAMRRWNGPIREQANRPEFQSCKMLMETDGFGNKIMPKISSTLARNIMTKWSNRINTATEQAIMNAFISSVVIELEGAYEDGVEPETNTNEYMEEILF